MSKRWSIQKHTISDKFFEIRGPEDITIWVDYDDVYHAGIDEIAKNIVNTLNNHYGKPDGSEALILAERKLAVLTKRVEQLEREAK